MLDIVKKISYVIKYEKGKVLVHGHSVDGRCCLVIACFSIFYFNKNADEAIKDIRKKRNNAINNSSQDDFCRRFEIYINML
jgi:protein-tyrosine phosphatase